MEGRSEMEIDYIIVMFWCVCVCVCVCVYVCVRVCVYMIWKESRQAYGAFG